MPSIHKQSLRQLERLKLRSVEQQLTSFILQVAKARRT